MLALCPGGRLGGPRRTHYRPDLMPAMFDVSATPPIGRRISRAAPGVLDWRVRHRRRRPNIQRRGWNPYGTICNHLEDSRPLDVAGVGLLVPGPKAHPQGPRNQRPTRLATQPESGVSEPVDKHRGSGHEFRTRRLLVRFRTSQKRVVCGTDDPTALRRSMLSEHRSCRCVVL